MKVSAKLLVMIPAIVIGGCGNFNSIHRDLDISNGRGAIVDVKQRAIIVDTTTTPNGTVKDRSVCAEPSPDALSAYAAEIAANLSKQGGGELGLALATQESASFIGLRTQTIQLLRDGMYRLCEARLNGVSEGNYAHLMRRYQRNMVALMAIEQLSGVVKAPVVTISAESQASAAQSINSLRKAANEVASLIADKEKRFNELKAKTTPSDAEKAELVKLEADIKELKVDKTSIDDAIRNARGLAAGGSLTANVVIPPSAVQERVSAEIAAKIEALSSKILEQNDTPFMCFEYLMNYELEGGKSITFQDGKIIASGNLTTQDALAIRCLDIVVAQPITLAESIDLLKKLKEAEISLADLASLADGPINSLIATTKTQATNPSLSSVKK